MEENKKPNPVKKEGLWQFIKFTFVSTSVGIVQIILVNVFYLVMAEGSSLPYFLSNLLANIYGYFVNGKATFKSKAPVWCLVVYVVVIAALILVMTAFQKWLVSLMTASSWHLLVVLAPTLAAAAAGTIQMAVLFPLEKFVLFTDRSNDNAETKK